MKYDFETLVDRSQNGSAKWNGMKDHNPAVAKNIAPLSVADLDLKLAPEIAEGMLEFMQNNPVFGYTNGTAAYYDADKILYMHPVAPTQFSQSALFLPENVQGYCC